MMNKRFSVLKRIISFKYAFNGLKVLLLEEHNARVHLVAAILVIVAGFYFHLSKVEWMLVIFAIGFVFAMELLNSAIENLADIITLDKDERIKKTKDLAAGGVLFAALTALIIGLIIFIPKIIAVFT
ncbi:diacylglycerol kinase family protein [Carboxylicivirga sp. RSCT41]|uniref:diacylglycerol kinase family protein n=1 Tax=Carboxylicivirga agarovorans TaxID=3417570 RepID=UPI003D342AE9